MRMAACVHLEETSTVEPRTTGGCEDCLAGGTRWVHLRLCEQCGKVGCCDSSRMRHATAHYRESGHPVIHSLEPGETWRWCYVDEVGG
jgi:hypothetical protein